MSSSSNPPADPAPATAPSADAIADQLQAGNQAVAETTAAVQQATATAKEISGEISSVPKAPAPAADEIPGAIAAPTPAAPPQTPPPAAPVDAKSDTDPLSDELRKLLSIEVPVIVQLGIRRMNVQEVMRFSVGAIVEFQKGAEDDLDLLANNKPIGKGHAVKVGENFGIKLTAIGSVKETIRALGAGK